jgi:hypothetical protein
VTEQISATLQIFSAVHLTTRVAQVEFVKRRGLGLPGRRGRPGTPGMRPGKHSADDEDDADNQHNDNRQPEEVVSPERAGFRIEETMHFPNVTGQPFEGMTTLWAEPSIIE